MDSDRKLSSENPSNQHREDVPTFCWKELLDRAFTGWEPADQTLERIIDRADRKP